MALGGTEVSEMDLGAVDDATARKSDRQIPHGVQSAGTEGIALRVNLRVDQMGVSHKILLIAAMTTLSLRRRHKNSNKDHVKREEQCTFQWVTKLLVGLWLSIPTMFSMIRHLSTGYMQPTSFLTRSCSLCMNRRYDSSGSSRLVVSWPCLL